MKNIIITIGREYGSGGKFIGESVAKKLDIPFYDKNILVEAAKNNKVNLGKLEELDEKYRSDFYKKLELLNFNNLNNNLSSDIIEYYISKEIKNLALKGSCVILGRNSNNILKDRDNVINIFIYSNNLEFKLKRKMQLENMNREETLKRLNFVDKERKRFYESFDSNLKWGSKSDYDYLIDSSILGIDETINLIVDIYNKLEKQ